MANEEQGKLTCKSAAERAMAFREDGCPINEKP
jgi:hypothetical protein